MDNENQEAYDVAFAELVADMIGVQLELEEGNTEEALQIAKDSVEKNNEKAMEVFDGVESEFRLDSPD